LCDTQPRNPIYFNIGSTKTAIENSLKAAADMAPTIAKLAREHELVLTHGNGPQVGELALERSAAT